MGSRANFPLNFKASPMTSVQQKAGQMDTDGVEPLKTTTEIRNMDSVQRLVRGTLFVEQSHLSLV